MLRAAVIGSPITHSLSPVLHNAAYTALGLDLEYTRLECTESEVPALVSSLGREWVGLSCTMPTKRAALAFASSVTERTSSRALGTFLTRTVSEAFRMMWLAVAFGGLSARCPFSALKSPAPGPAAASFRDWAAPPFAESLPPPLSSAAPEQPVRASAAASSRPSRSSVRTKSAVSMGESVPDGAGSTGDGHLRRRKTFVITPRVHGGLRVPLNGR